MVFIICRVLLLAALLLVTAQANSAGPPAVEGFMPLAAAHVKMLMVECTHIFNVQQRFQMQKLAESKSVSDLGVCSNIVDLNIASLNDAHACLMRIKFQLHLRPPIRRSLNTSAKRTTGSVLSQVLRVHLELIAIDFQ